LDFNPSHFIIAYGSLSVFFFSVVRATSVKLLLSFSLDCAVSLFLGDVILNYLALLLSLRLGLWVILLVDQIWKLSPSMTEFHLESEFLSNEACLHMESIDRITISKIALKVVIAFFNPL
jgi:hypothetical protein